MSGEVESHGGASASPTLQYGPTGGQRSDTPFTARQLSRLDEALTMSSKEAGVSFSVYVGELTAPTRGHAEQLFDRLTDDSVLVAVSPGERSLHIVTGSESAKRLPNRSCALAALAMRASFANGDLIGGIVIGLRMLADAAGTTR